MPPAAVLQTTPIAGYNLTFRSSKLNQRPCFSDASASTTPVGTAAFEDDDDDDDGDGDPLPLASGSAVPLAGAWCVPT